MAIKEIVQNGLNKLLGKKVFVTIKTTDSVLAGFNQAIVDLQEVEDRHRQTALANDARVVELEAEAAAALTAAARANAVRYNLSRLIGGQHE